MSLEAAGMQDMCLGAISTPSRCNLCGLEVGLSRAWLIGRERRFGFPGQFTLRQCPRCTLIFLWPQPSAEVLSAYYPTGQPQHRLRPGQRWLPGWHKPPGIPPGTYAAYRPARLPRGGWRRRLKRAILDRAVAGAGVYSFCAHHLWPELPVGPRAGQPAPRALDVGCGNGAYLLHLRALGWQVAGVEPNSTAALDAGRRFRLFVHSGTLGSAPFARESFDLVTFRHVLEHVPNPLADLRRAACLLRPGGQLLIECPNAAALARRVFSSYWFHLDLPRHLYHFMPQSLGALLRAAGFRVVHMGQVASTAGITGSLQYMVNARTCRPADNFLRWSRLARLLAWPLSQGAAWAGRGDILRVWAVKL